MRPLTARRCCRGGNCQRHSEVRFSVTLAFCRVDQPVRSEAPKDVQFTLGSRAYLMFRGGRAEHWYACPRIDRGRRT